MSTQNRFLMVDVNYSRSAQLGAVLAARILSPEPGLFMTSGTSVPMSRDTLDQLARSLHEEHAGRKALRDFANLSAGERARFAATVIRTAVKAGATWLSWSSAATRSGMPAPTSEDPCDCHRYGCGDDTPHHSRGFGCGRLVVREHAACDERSSSLEYRMSKDD